MLSVIINTKNAEKTLARTLESVKFADEIVLVDQHSQDKTREIARHHGVKLFLFDDLGRVEPEARNFALSKTNGDWILVIDADEVVPLALAQKIKQLIQAESQSLAGYYLPRRNLIFGQWMRHSGWWPDYQLRLFKKDQAHWQAGVHHQVKVVGALARLEAQPTMALVHYNYDTVASFVSRMQRYSSLKATEAGSLQEEQTMVSRDFAQKFFHEWLRRLFHHQAYLDGGRGVALSFLQATYELLVDLKRWEAAGFKESKQNQLAGLFQVLRHFNRDLNYWLADYQVERTTGLKKIYWQIRRKLKL